MEKKTYKVKFVKYESIGGHVEYTVKIVTSEGDETFHIRDRYSSMRDYWKAMYNDYGPSAPSTFPPKKWFGNTESKFVRHRMEELEHFFNTLLEDPDLATSPVTQTYFKKKRIKMKEASEKKHKTIEIEETKEVRKKVGRPNQQVSNTMSLDKNWRHVVDVITKDYIDICFGEEPMPPEEVKKKTQEYSDKIKSSLNTLPYISKVLNLPKCNEQSFTGLSLDLINAGKDMSEWLDEKMLIIKKLASNEENAVYKKENSILNVFEASQ